MTSQKWKKVEIRPAQRFSRSRPEPAGEDPDIGLPVTYKAGKSDEHHQQQADGARQGQSLTAGEEAPHRSASRERWSFSPPRNWVERPSRPLTRAVTARRQRERAGHRQRGRADAQEGAV